MAVWTCEACGLTHEVPEGTEEYRDCLQGGERFQVATHEGWTYAEETDIALCPDHALPFAEAANAGAVQVRDTP
jgi:hypothetical protein